jgi:uncharacterized protein (TIGR02444 family)
MAAEFPPSPFWDFSLALYAKPGVAAACLGLQERHGADVNLLMFCLWLGAERRRLDAAAMAAVAEAAGEWHATVVRGLRAIRKRLKTPIGGADTELAAALRARVQAIEIDAEHIEQLLLAAMAPAAPPGAGSALDCGATNCALYMARLGARLSASDREDLALVLANAFAVDRAVAVASLGGAAP